MIINSPDMPVFIISLDTELIWGYVSYPSNKIIHMLKNDKKKARGCINILLNLFEKHNIPATWAVVGHLFLDHCEYTNGMPHKDMPRFNENWYSIDPCTDIKKEPLFYGRDIIEKILSTQIKHEIGYHSFSHVPFSDCTREVAEAEIKKGIELAKEFNITFESFVYPENKIGHVDILKKYGFKIYRGQNSRGNNANKIIPLRIINFTKSEIMGSPVEPIFREGIWEIPGSMQFSDPLFPYNLVSRAKLGTNKAIRNNKIFNVFLHPGTLLAEPILEKKLDNFLAFVANKRDEGKIHVMTMGNYAKVLNNTQNND
jgi:peptidoglycan/xylan/chitin deacetylase (PgdA/CDA1 family)